MICDGRGHGGREEGREGGRGGREGGEGGREGREGGREGREGGEGGEGGREGGETEVNKIRERKYPTHSLFVVDAEICGDGKDCQDYDNTKEVERSVTTAAGSLWFLCIYNING